MATPSPILERPGVATAGVASGPVATAPAARAHRPVPALPPAIGALGRQLRNVAVAFVHWPVRALAALLPKEPDLWVFGARGGGAFTDNSRWLFEHVRRHEPGIRAVWMTPDALLRARLVARGFAACHPCSWQGYRLSLRAGVAVISDARSDLNRFATGGDTLVVQLWHGTPIEKIGRDERVAPRRGWRQRLRAALKRLSAWLLPAQRETFDLLTAGSELSAGSFLSAFGVPRAQVVTTGLARTDVVLAGREQRRSRPRRIAYLPASGGAGVDLAVAEPALAAMDAELWVEARASIGIPGETGRVRRLEVEDLHEQLASFDVLITDFSSVFPDFLLLDRPVVFLVPGDESRLRRSRDLYYDFDWIAPGPRARTWDEALRLAADLLADPSQWSAERARVCRLFHDHQDGRSCQRIVTAIRAEQARRNDD